METYKTDDLEITLNIVGAKNYTKVSFPIRYGCFSEIKTRDFIFQFNINGEVRFMKGRNCSWPDPNEWLKRTAANDWVYYSSAGYKGTYSLLGEYYIPCFSYSLNPVFTTYFFDKNLVQDALDAFHELFDRITSSESVTFPERIRQFLDTVNQHNPDTLALKAKRLYSAIDGHITVLPPDARHVDYDVLPVIIADGCLYNCGFCSVKTGQSFSKRNRKQVAGQLEMLKDLYGDNLKNYNSVFLGQHDALHAGTDLVIFAAKKAYDIFEFKKSNIHNPMLFMFGSVDSLLRADDNFFVEINRLPYYSYINIGLESADQETLQMIKKPVSVDTVEAAFDRLLDINRRFGNIEITANFLMGNNLSQKHYNSIVELTKSRLEKFYSKGALYLSPLDDCGSTRKLKKEFIRLKNASMLPTFIYIIQRL